MSILYYIFSFIISYSLTRAEVLKENDKVSLIYYEYYFNLSEMNLDIKNRDASILEEVSCHLAFIKDENEEHKEIFDFYSTYLNRQWLFFTDNENTLNKLLKINYERKDIYLLGILIPKNANFTIDKYHGIPVFEIDNNYTKYMEKWDMRNADKNIFFTLKINHPDEYYPENYFLLLSLILFLASISILIFWKISAKKVNPIHILHFHKLGFIAIYLNILICTFLVMKSINIKGKRIYDEESDVTILLDVVVTFMSTLHKTYIWFFILLMSIGFNISLQQINVRSCKFLLKMALLMFLVFTMDEFIDIFIGPIFRINMSEIKNLFFYFLLIKILLKHINKNIQFLNLKIHYSRIINPEYIDALFYKIKLFKKFRIIVICYFISFLIILILQKTVLYKYDSFIFEVYNYLALDFANIYSFLLLLRPKKLPENYNINLGDDLDIERGEIYSYALPKYSEAHLKITDLTKKEVDICKKNEIPIIIVGPNVKNIKNVKGNNENENNNNSNNSYSINKYFLNLNIGFSNNNKK